MIPKIRLLLSAATFFLLVGCTANQEKNEALAEGMFKVAILYANGDGTTFDMEYYEQQHMPMVAGFLGDNLKLYEIDKGISGRTPDSQAPFVAVGYFYVEDVAAYHAAIAQNRDAIVGDFKNYTNVQPVVQISEIKQVVHTEGK